jgi:hypothetical protein
MPPQFMVNYVADARAFARELIGRDFTDEELAHAVGALDGAVLEVRKKKGADELRIDLQHPFMQEQERWLRRDAQGDLLIFNYRFYKKPAAPKGVSVDSLLRQVVGAQALGAKRLETFGAGDFTTAGQPNGEIGYWHWAKCGFDAPLSQYYQGLAAAERGLEDVKTLNEVIDRPGGADWWYRVGAALTMKFDLAFDSSMMRIFRDYVRRKGKIL